MAPPAKNYVIDLSILDSDDEPRLGSRKKAPSGPNSAANLTSRRAEAYPKGMKSFVDLTSDDSTARSARKDNALDRLAHAYSPVRFGPASSNRFKDVRSSGSTDATPRTEPRKTAGSSPGQGSTQNEAFVIDSDDDESELTASTKSAKITKTPIADVERDSSVLQRQTSMPMPPSPGKATKKRRLVTDQSSDGSSLPVEKRRRLDIRNNQSRPSSSAKSSPRLMDTGSAREPIRGSSPSRPNVSALKKSDITKSSMKAAAGSVAQVSSDPLPVAPTRGGTTPGFRKPSVTSSGSIRKTSERGVPDQQPKSPPKRDESSLDATEAGAESEPALGAQRVRSLQTGAQERFSSAAARQLSKEGVLTKNASKSVDLFAENTSASSPRLKIHGERTTLRSNGKSRSISGGPVQSPSDSQSKEDPLLQSEESTKLAAGNRTSRLSRENSTLDKQSPAPGHQAKTRSGASTTGAVVTVVPKATANDGGPSRPSPSRSPGTSKHSSAVKQDARKTVHKTKSGVGVDECSQHPSSSSKQGNAAISGTSKKSKLAAAIDESLNPAAASTTSNSEAATRVNTETSRQGASEILKIEEIKKKLLAEMLTRTANMGPPPSKPPRGKIHGPNDVVPSRESEGGSHARGVDPDSRQRGLSVNDEASAQLHSEMEARPSGTADASVTPSVGDDLTSTPTPHIVTTATPTPTPFNERKIPVSDNSAVPKSDTVDEKYPQLSSMLTLSQQVEHAVGKYYAEMREDTEYYTKHMLKRARMSAPKRVEPQTRVSGRTLSATPTGSQRLKAWSVFASIPAIAVVPTAPSSKTPQNTLKLNFEIWNGSAKRPTQAYFVQPTICDVDDAKDVPGYAHYVSLKGNLLAPNTLTMNVWPYFGDDNVATDTFKDHYYLDTKDRERKLRRLLQSQRAEVYAMSALEELKISWNDVLHFLMNDDYDADDTVEDNVRKAIANRDTFCKEDFPRSSDKWVFVRSAVQEAAEPVNMPKAALLCDIFQRMFKFPLWHIARRSGVVTEILKGQERAPASTVDRICRICMRFNCHHHGEYREIEDIESDIAHESDEAVATDLVHPQNVNFRKRIPFRPSSGNQAAAAPEKPVPASRKDCRHWEGGKYAKAEERGPFYPCDHPGLTCEQAECSCVKNRTPCEKTCGCSLSCPRRFQGCSCSNAKHRKPREHVCFADDRCACYQLGRECDPDLCGACGVLDVLDPVNRHNHGILTSNCRNASLQRGSTKHTLLGDSGVHGMGLYACETIKQDDFVGEYKGEVITKEEADRRGAVYEHQNLSYLFSLNKKQEVDSTFYGNKIRFINHRDASGANVYARIILVNTVHRIGLFGQREVKPGQELFFDYGPQFPDVQLGGKDKGTKSAPHVRNANITREFYDVEEEEDEVGNLRARKAIGGKSRGRPRKDGITRGSLVKKKGGARPGAGRRKEQKSELLALNVSNPEAVFPGLEDDEAQPSPGHRLSAYNVADEPVLDDNIVDAGAEADEDDDFDPDALDDNVSADESEESSEGNAEDEMERPRRGRPGSMRGVDRRGRF